MSTAVSSRVYNTTVLSGLTRSTWHPNFRPGVEISWSDGLTDSASSCARSFTPPEVEEGEVNWAKPRELPWAATNHLPRLEPDPWARWHNTKKRFAGISTFAQTTAASSSAGSGVSSAVSSSAVSSGDVSSLGSSGDRPPLARSSLRGSSVDGGTSDTSTTPPSSGQASATDPSAASATSSQATFDSSGSATGSDNRVTWPSSPVTSRQSPPQRTYPIDSPGDGRDNSTIPSSRRYPSRKYDRGGPKTQHLRRYHPDRNINDSRNTFSSSATDLISAISDMTNSSPEETAVTLDMVTEQTFGQDPDLETTDVFGSMLESMAEETSFRDTDLVASTAHSTTLDRLWEADQQHLDGALRSVFSRLNSGSTIPTTTSTGTSSSDATRAATTSTAEDDSLDRRLREAKRVNLDGRTPQETLRSMQSGV